MKTRIESGQYEILESNSIFLDEPDSELTLHLCFDEIPFGDLKIGFENVQEEAGEKITVGKKDGIPKITCVNFNSSLGTGTTKAMSIGELNGKNVKFHIWSYLIGKGNVRKVEYSIYKEL